MADERVHTCNHDLCLGSELVLYCFVLVIRFRFRWHLDYTSQGRRNPLKEEVHVPNHRQGVVRRNIDLRVITRVRRTRKDDEGKLVFINLPFLCSLRSSMEWIR